MNSNPREARVEARRRKKIRKYGDLDAAKRKLWQAITTAEEIMLNPNTDDQTALKSIHAVSQSTSVYARLHEQTEVQNELEELKKEVSELRESLKTRSAA